MPLNKQFIKAEVVEKPNYTVLKITYNWYYVMEYTETFVCDNLEQAKTILLSERSRDHVKVIGKDGKNKNLELL